MTTVTRTNTSERSSLSDPKRTSGWPLVLTTIAFLSIAGWAYLAAMVADMIPAMDMSEAGPGMGIFNQFNIFKGLSAEARVALAALCLPAGSTFGMPGPEMTIQDLQKIFLMWAMMSLAMMLPSASPMLRAYTMHISTPERTRFETAMQAVMVVIGYLLVWFGYALVATAFQWLLSRIGGLNDMMAPVSLALTTSVLFAAGLYQFTPAKRACLKRCWYPRWSFSNEMGSNRITVGLREGIVQGWSCLGCCWAVMTVMFAVGLMNIVWIALLGGVMALEKTFPSRIFPVIIGVFLISWATFLTTVILFKGAAL
ncbi:DUF2182 domain-containing protein [Roseibium sp. SCPC15]|uniref:DUF2182 domain-containing protein n=1 Tax=Roseibium sp. SCP15 TaxID=3141376 RepID=UPI003339B73E